MRKLLLFAILVATIACQKDDPVTPTPDPTPIIETIEIAGTGYILAEEDFNYGTGHEREILDVIEPIDRPIEGTAVLFHGGAYVRYDKDTLYTDPVFSKEVSSLLDAGIRVVNANYKYLEDVGLSNPISSGGLVIEYAATNYGKIVVGGVSAGAGISLYNSLNRDDVLGIIALEMQDLDVNQWEEVFPDLNVEQTRAIPAFNELYIELYGDTDASNWSLEQYLGNGTPLYILNTVDRPFSLFDTDNLYHNINHAAVFGAKAVAAGHPVITHPTTLTQFALTAFQDQ